MYVTSLVPDLVPQPSTVEDVTSDVHLSSVTNVCVYVCVCVCARALACTCVNATVT